MEPNFGSLEVFLLHHHPEFMESCADLLNLQWPRSKTARLHSLGKSCDTLPCSLVLVTSLSVDGHPGRVIGHSMLSQVIAMEDACFVESVLVDPQLRGKGLGRRLMGASEDYAALLGYRTVYLSTHDKQEFYGHLGYEFCDPISKLDSCTKLLPAGLLKQLGMSSSAKQHQLPSPKERKSVKKTQEETDLENKNYSAVSLPVKELSTPPSVVNILSPLANVAPPANIPPPPPTNIPPPPPPPPPTNIPPLPPPPPTNIPPPPPPPPPPPTTNLQPPQALPRSSKTNLEIVNMDSNQISWMKKELDKK